jgi:hypothetical protein
MGTGNSFPRGKAGGARNLPLTSPLFKVKNTGAIPPLPIHLHGFVLNYLINYARGQFYVYLTQHFIKTCGYVFGEST